MRTDTGTSAGSFQPLGDDDPRTVGAYRLVARLGSGGMGRVYLSYTPGGRPVAVKVIRPELADDGDFRERFRQEVANARRVHGVYTAPVLDSDIEGPTPWLATAYVAGPSLAEAVKAHGPLPLSTVLLLTAGVAEALQDIHRAGIVHRDLKPSNVLLALDGPRVIDFGVARAVDATALTHSGSAVGTPAFMAPEQALGGEITGAADVFALGQIAAFAATGVGAFGDGPSHGVLYRIVHEEPRLGAVPEELAELVEGCLRKESAKRLTPADVIRLCAAADPDGGLRRSEGWLPASVAGRLARHAVDEAPPLLAPDDTMALRLPREGGGAGTGPDAGPGAGYGRGPAPAPAGAFGPPPTAGPPGTPGTPPPTGTPGTPPAGSQAQGYAPVGAFAGSPGHSPAPPWSAPTGPARMEPAPARRGGRRALVAAGVLVLTVATVTGALFVSGVLRPGGDPGDRDGRAGQAAGPSVATTQPSTGSAGPSAKPSASASASPSSAPGATPTAPGASAVPTAPTQPTPSVTPTGPGKPAPVTYGGIRMTGNHDLYLADRPVRSKADTGTSDEDLTYAVYSSGAVVAPGSTSRSQLTRLAPRAAGTSEACLAQSDSEKYVWVRDLAVGDRLCVVSGTGHVALITFRGTAPAPNTTAHITLDVQVWRNAAPSLGG